MVGLQMMDVSTAGNVFSPFDERLQQHGQASHTSMHRRITHLHEPTSPWSWPQPVLPEGEQQTYLKIEQQVQ